MSLFLERHAKIFRDNVSWCANYFQIIQPQKSIHRKQLREFPLWHKGISSVSAAPGHRFNPLHSGLKDQHHCSMAQVTAVAWIPGRGTPFTAGQPRKKRKKTICRQMEILSAWSHLVFWWFHNWETLKVPLDFGHKNLSPETLICYPSRGQLHFKWPSLVPLKPQCAVRLITWG